MIDDEQERRESVFKRVVVETDIDDDDAKAIAARIAKMKELAREFPADELDDDLDDDADDDNIDDRDDDDDDA